MERRWNVRISKMKEWLHLHLFRNCKWWTLLIINHLSAILFSRNVLASLPKSKNNQVFLRLMLILYLIKSFMRFQIHSHFLVTTTTYFRNTLANFILLQTTVCTYTYYVISYLLPLDVFKYLEQKTYMKQIVKSQSTVFH